MLRLSGTLVRVDGGWSAAQDAEGACSFFQSHDHRCAIHRTAGVAALPLTCRMFPRIVRHDGAGSRLSLSHFCPTAAALLFAPAGVVAVVEAPEPLAGIGPLDGLDARSAWPPLLRPGVLMGVAAYDSWERRGVEMLMAAPGSPREALAALRRMTNRVTRWRPDCGVALDDIVSDAAAAGAPAGPAVSAASGPLPIASAQSAEPSAQGHTAIRRWLAARLFGNWIAYQGHGLATVLAYLDACLDVLDVELARHGNLLEAIRRSDLLLLHQADSQQLATLLDKGV